MRRRLCCRVLVSGAAPQLAVRLQGKHSGSLTSACTPTVTSWLAGPPSDQHAGAADLLALSNALRACIGMACSAVSGHTDASAGSKLLSQGCSSSPCWWPSAATKGATCPLELQASDVILPIRVLHLPMAFEERCVRGAIQRYMKSVRPEAPYLPSNVDFVAANNGLKGEEAS